ncbi:Ribonuclease H-like domain containing protein [Trema orientale]|uniref:Ribonuclease H-like domain containing protein n=1 Tax=Trema orientale TaxID=63057 RepID=A0A2P5FIE7_TREOI|nr:Ribonuclease H-like domain containing protein [Trema orientale]
MDLIFTNCAYSHFIWSQVASTFEVDINVSMGIANIIIQAMWISFSPQISTRWKSTVITTILSIWHARNHILFEDLFILVHSTLAYIWAANNTDIGGMHNSQRDVVLLNGLYLTGRPSCAPRISSVHWNPPSAGWLNVNMDESSLGQLGFSSCGGVFRNSRGFVLGCFASKLGMGFSFEVELVGVVMAISIAFVCGWHRFWIESDSTYVVGLLKSRSKLVPWNHRNRWLHVLHMVHSIQIYVSHIYRERNQVVDSLAFVTLEDNQWWSYAPDFIKSLVFRDFYGLDYYHFR